MTETVVVGDEIGLVVEGTLREGHVLNRRFTFESSAQGLKDTVKLTELYSTELDVVLQYRRIVEREHLGTVTYHREESHLIAFGN